MTYLLPFFDNLQLEFQSVYRVIKEITEKINSELQLMVGEISKMFWPYFFSDFISLESNIWTKNFNIYLGPEKFLDQRAKSDIFSMGHSA